MSSPQPRQEAAEPQRPVMTHELKCHPGAFRAVKSLKKKCEIRKDDRGFCEGHNLFLREWDPGDEIYTGDELMVRVTHLTRGPDWGIPRGMVVMSVVPIPMPSRVKGDDDRARRARVVEERHQRDAQGAEDL